MKKKIGVVRFLGTNCDQDVIDAYKKMGAQAEFIWWADHFDHSSYDALIMPGGFSYGDYLRAGAIAARTPAMDDVRKAADAGKPILGICNGFQVLTESGLLPGVLTKNSSRQFQEEWVEVKAASSQGVWSRKLEGQKTLKLPIAHSMGRFVHTDTGLEELFQNDGVWLQYVRNPNGALRDIAGVKNKKGNVAALMPHPERAISQLLGSDDGRSILEAVL